jgi:hypothetical protein
VPATFGSGGADAVSLGEAVGVTDGVGVGVDEAVLGEGELGAAPLSSDEEHAARATSETPAPPRSIARLVARTLMGPP